jgi:hypothetical protein
LPAQALSSAGHPSLNWGSPTDCHTHRQPKTATPLTLPNCHQPVTTLCATALIPIHISNHVTLLTISSYNGQITLFLNPQIEKRLIPYYHHDTGLALELAGANIMKSGNVIIHMKAPHTALQVLQVIQLNDSHDVMLAGKEIPGFSCLMDYAPSVELDVPWHGVVIHDIPAQPLMELYQGDEDTESLQDVVKEQTGLSGSDIWDLWILCQDEDMEKKEHLSI